MAFTQADIDTLDRAIAKGVRVVQFADRKIEYGSFAELRAARDAIRSELAKQAHPGRARRVLFYHAGKGIE
ncbi:hypothetical protein FNU76_02410 [Chitinimonas arctica]|uniref:Uncharacterized protein n=1 Tax=Chitinimonas arctica TaxID=2594795 RepID=A0A516SAX2_9NEIS|nr:hypothetical protein [Chitinimonas arctica]QDQ25296.1 hypothetical protein FNU76_02410 [Chitinimonas arctica]